MPTTIPPMGNVIDLTAARKYPCQQGIANAYATCGNHQATTCPSCNRLWRLDQLRHRAIGYYPGERETAATVTQEQQPSTSPDSPNTGSHYAWLCPVCMNDVTDLVCLHVDACNLATLANVRPDPSTAI